MARTELTGKQIKDRSVDLAVDVDGVLPVSNGGTGVFTLTVNALVAGNGNGAVQTISPGPAGTVLASNGSSWVATSVAGSGDVNSESTSSVDGEVAVFSGTSGKSIGRATGSGIAALTDGVLSTVAAPSGDLVGTTGAQSLSDKELVSPTVVGATGTDLMTLKLPDGTTVFTFNQYGELVSQVGYGVHYDSNVSTTAFSTYGPMFLTSGKGSADDHDVTIAPSGAGKINLSGATEVDGVPVVTTTGTQTLTGKTISGADNSISAIPQSAVTDLVGDLAGKEPVLISGTTAQYLRGDKTWQTLDKTAVGLGNVDDTADLDKPVSTATQSALDGKQDASEKGVANGFASLDGDGLVPTSQLPLFGAVDSVNGQTGVVVLDQGDVGLGNVDDTSDLDKPVSTATQAALDLKEDAANKGQPSGFASLDAQGLVPQEQLPITTADWDTLEGRPAVIAAGATEAEARTAIGAEWTGNKGQTGGYAALDETGRVPLAQVPPGVVIDGVQVSDDAFQLLSGETPVGDPISLLVSVADGGTPYTTEVLRIDGGRLS